MRYQGWLAFVATSILLWGVGLKSSGTGLPSLEWLRYADFAGGTFTLYWGCRLLWWATPAGGDKGMRGELLDEEILGDPFDWGPKGRAMIGVFLCFMSGALFAMPGFFLSI